MIEYEDKEGSFDFEKFICFEKTELWRNKADDLFSSAQVLYEFEQFKLNDILYKEKKLKTLFSSDISDKYFRCHSIIRMNWGYGFENILKGIIIKDLKRKTTETFVPINKIKTHNLIDLFKNAGFTLYEEQQFYINIVQKCTIWMGRYPLPVKANQMYERRAGMNSRHELIEREKLLLKKLINGEIVRRESEFDILNSFVGFKEYEIINELIILTKAKFDLL